MKREEELRQQIAALKAASRQEPTACDGNIDQSFWGQPFSEEIDETPIPTNFKEIVAQIYIIGGNDKLSCKLFLVTLRGVAMQWMTTLPTKSICTFNDLARSFVSQFAANIVKKLEVANLFDIKQAKGESLKGYLAYFNNVTVWVNDPNQKFFVKAFQKRLWAGPFSDALALRQPASMEEIRVRAEKHIEVEEDQAEHLETENASNSRGQQAEEHKRQGQTRSKQVKQHFTSLTEQRTQILREICHTRLLKFSQEVEGKIMGRNKDDWCNFHRTFGHWTEGCWTLRTQLEKLVQEGRLNRYVQRQGREDRGRDEEDRGQNHERRILMRETRRSWSRLREDIPRQHRGTIATISRGTRDAWPTESKLKETREV
ncbi:hypothetical protein CR513_39525, partial [Mucuna pruriens]